MKVAIYLRKSRQDEEAEKKGEHETLNRHRSTLLKLAKEQNLNVIEIKEEIVSGESVSYRPKMIELLEEVRNKKYDAVLVMDIDRLGRGNMQDQGLILDTFKQSKTKIITPRKVYDLSNEWDEEYSEFEAFMARKELKLITRRMQRGKIKSVEEGKFIATNAPYGYKIIYEGKERKLVIDEEKAEVVKMIFDMYSRGLGAYKIASQLNALGLKTSTGRTFYEKAIRDIIKNKIYCGYIVWNKVERKKNSTRIRDEEELIEAKGLHEPIISEELWIKANNIRINRSTPSVADNKILTNPLAGLVRCKCCGLLMTCNSSTSKEGYVKYLRCKNCNNNRGVKLHVIEKEILDYLAKLLYLYKNNFDEISIVKEESKEDKYSKMLISLEKEAIKLNNQKDNLHDLLERGIYDVDTYLNRSKILTEKIEINKQSIDNIKLKLKQEKEVNLSFDSLVPDIEFLLDRYDLLENISEKNKLLKTVIDEIIYYKPKKRTAKFEMDIKLKYI